MDRAEQEQERDGVSRQANQHWSCCNCQSIGNSNAHIRNMPVATSPIHTTTNGEMQQHSIQHLFLGMRHEASKYARETSEQKKREKKSNSKNKTKLVFGL